MNKTRHNLHSSIRSTRKNCFKNERGMQKTQKSSFYALEPSFFEIFKKGHNIRIKHEKQPKNEQAL